MTIAGSAGAFEGIWRVLSSLPANLPAALAIVLHTGLGSRLSETLALRSRLPVRDAVTGDRLCRGCVYVARPCTHLVVNPDSRLSVSEADAVRRFRPSADWLFESAAASYRERHVAIVLSGLLSDGAARLRAVKRLGGTVLVQSPLDAPYPDMPLAAIATGLVDRIVAIDAMAAAVSDAVEQCEREVDLMSWEAPFGGSDRVAAAPS